MIEGRRGRAKPCHSATSGRAVGVPSVASELLPQPLPLCAAHFTSHAKSQITDSILILTLNIDFKIITTTGSTIFVHTTNSACTAPFLQSNSQRNVQLAARLNEWVHGVSTADRSTTLDVFFFFCPALRFEHRMPRDT